MAIDASLPRVDTTEDEETRVFVASQWRLMWWRFKKHKMAMVSTGVVLAMYLVSAGAEFLSIAHPEYVETNLGYLPPQGIRWFDEGSFRPHVLGLSAVRDPVTFKKVFTPDPEDKIPLRFFVRGFKYEILGFVTTDRHLIGIPAMPGKPACDLEGRGAKHDCTPYLLGSDKLGRDIWSRMIYATRISMSIGLVGVTLSLFLGITLGGVSGFFGGITDTLIQRLIEIIRSVPTLPLWLGLAAAVPRNWSILRIYFAITLVISLFAWTEMARVVRGRFLAMREEEFVMAARLSGSSNMRIIFRHMVPSFMSHIVTIVTLSIPGMIIGETALSFLGLGLRAPAISWGVLLRAAQNVQSIALYPWMMVPALAVTLAVLAFNFMGDGIRDAADPYG